MGAQVLAASTPAALPVPAASPAIIAGCEPGIHQASALPVTELALLYVHGFSACPMEIEPVFSEAAEALRANTLKVLLPGHGIAGGEGLRGVSAEDWRASLASGVETLGRLGKKRAVIATSTGASLALDHLAARPDPTEIDALVLISPNFGLPRWDAELLLLPWGLGELIARFAVGEYRTWTARNADQARYWTTKYPSGALVEMMKTVRRAREAPLEKLRVPTLVLYCENDDVLDVSALKKNVARIGAATGFPAKLVLGPCDEDPHVLAGRILAPRSSARVRDAIVDFLRPFD